MAERIFVPKRNRQVAAFGETKMLKEWADDPRCLVDMAQLRERIFTKHKRWEPEIAILAPRGTLWQRRTDWVLGRLVQLGRTKFEEEVPVAHIYPEGWLDRECKRLGIS